MADDRLRGYPPRTVVTVIANTCPFGPLMVSEPVYVPLAVGTFALSTWTAIVANWPGLILPPVGDALSHGAPSLTATVKVALPQRKLLRSNV